MNELDAIFNFYDTYSETVSNLSAAAATNDVDGAVCPAGEIWVIQNIVAYNVNTDPTAVVLYVGGIGSLVMLRKQALPGANIAVRWTGELVIKESEYIRARFYGCTLNDDLWSFIRGYKMRLR